MLRTQVYEEAGAEPRIAGPISYGKPNGRHLQAAAKEGSRKASAAPQPELSGSWWVPDATEQKPAATEGSVAEQKGATTEGGSGKVCIALHSPFKRPDCFKGHHRPAPDSHSQRRAVLEAWQRRGAVLHGHLSCPGSSQLSWIASCVCHMPRGRRRRSQETRRVASRQWTASVLRYGAMKMPPS